MNRWNKEGRDAAQKQICASEETQERAGKHKEGQRQEGKKEETKEQSKEKNTYC